MTADLGTGVTELVDWLRERYDEIEAVALALAEGAGGGTWYISRDPLGVHVENGDGRGRIVSERGLDRGDLREWDRTLAFIVANDPDFVLADIAAKRQIIDLHESDGGHECPDGRGPFGPATGYERHCLTLRLLASVYADRPGFREEWCP